MARLSPHRPRGRHDHAPGTSIPDLPTPEAGLSGLIETWNRISAVPLTGPLAAFTRVDSAPHYIERITNVWSAQLADQPANDSLTRDLHRLLRRWHEAGDAAMLAEPHPVVLSRCDANLLNWLHAPAQGVTGCVDWEFADSSDPVFDAADLVEHISARQIDDAAWAHVVSQLGATAPQVIRRFGAAQRTCALRVLAVLWKQREKRAEEFSMQFERVRALQATRVAR